jgi:predicted aldo/keto reductase-like oxidoreductase
MKIMEFRNYKGGDERISLLGFGCMRLPQMDKDNPKDIDVKQANMMVELALEGGVNYFDTAYPYHEGASETFIGTALSSHPRDSFNLASKMPTWLVANEGDVDRLFAEQLEKCRVEFFDYYLVHGLNAERFETAQKFRIYEQLKEKQKQGLIRHLGCSVHCRPELLERIVDSYDWDFVQIQLNYLDWELQDARAQYLSLKGRGIPIIVMEPVRGGMLASLNENSVRILKDANPDATPASWALRYAGSFPDVLTVLSGMSDISQVKDNISTFTDFNPLSPYENEVLISALQAFRLSSTIPCTSCRYCMDCPAGVDIPKVLGAYNNYSIRKEIPVLFKLEYNVLGESKQAHNCVNCGQCVQHCPQGIDIPGWMGRINSLYRELCD